jgi:hypothetical protein
MSSDLSAEITAMATVALAAFAIVTAAIAIITYALSGSRVRVDTRYGMPMNHLDPRIPDTDPPQFLPEKLAAATARQDYTGILLFAVIQNTGRLAVTVQECMWHAHDKGKQPFKFGPISNPLSTPLPYRLEPGAQCYAVIDLASAMAVVNAPIRGKTPGRQVWPVVQLGTGRKREGKTVEVPAAPEAITQAASSQQAPDDPSGHSDSNSRP